ncbi:hypothetical protein T09_2859 [Trichinella sp. T9]|nr:hypothetical protein T09_2859 [Trichinella sp. T9]
MPNTLQVSLNFFPIIVTVIVNFRSSTNPLRESVVPNAYLNPLEYSEH